MPARDNSPHHCAAIKQFEATAGLKWERHEFIQNHRRREAVVKHHHQSFYL